MSTRVVQTAISLAALAAVVWWATRQERPELPASGTGGALLALALTLYAAATLARGERWHRILERTGITLPRADAYRLTTVGGGGVGRARELVRPLAAARRDVARGDGEALCGGSLGV